MISMGATTSLLHQPHQEVDAALPPPLPRPCPFLPVEGARRDEAQQVLLGQQQGDGRHCVGMGLMMIIMWTKGREGGRKRRWMEEEQEEEQEQQHWTRLICIVRGLWGSWL